LEREPFKEEAPYWVGVEKAFPNPEELGSNPWTEKEFLPPTFG